MAEAPYENGGLLRYRINKAADDISDLRKWQRDVDRDLTRNGERITQISEDQQDINRRIESVNRTLNRLLFTIATTGVGLSLSILASTGKI